MKTSPCTCIRPAYGLVLLVLFTFTISCGDNGLKPPPDPEFGAIQGTVTYEGEWPPEETLFDLRFVAYDKEPATVFDLVNFAVVSETLAFFEDEDTFLIEEVENGTYPLSGIAQKTGPNDLDWRPLALFDEAIIVEGDTVHITIHVDFDNPPDLPIQLKRIADEIDNANGTD